VSTATRDGAGEVVVVTGASSGIGASVAQEAARRGARVALVGRSRDRLAAVAAGLTAHEGGDQLVLACDVRDPASVDQAAATVRASLGTATAVVNSAGVCLPSPLADLTPDRWNETMAVNVTGSFLVARAFALQMRESGVAGSIVTVGSESGSIGMPGYVDYCASKAALVGLTKALAAELAPLIRVNLLCPGPVDTPMLRAEFADAPDPAAAWQAGERRIPLGRVGTSDEVADAVLWLLWDARFATGSVVPLDGGTTGAFLGARA
jgi:NAD(P)-dependent dehydrogenase (short-subunit alcohol dehydrogenase family)